jgi:hypothetical protein
MNLSQCVTCELEASLASFGGCQYGCAATHDFDAVQRQCVLNDSYCLAKNHSSNQCLECSLGSYLDQSKKRCVACFPTCSTCNQSNSTDQCITCAPGYQLNSIVYPSWVNPSNNQNETAQFAGQCTARCPTGEYLNESTGNCSAENIDKATNCRTFSNQSDSCTSCLGDYLLENGQCGRRVCAKGEYWNLNSSACKNCDKNCSACAGDASSCTACADGFELAAGVCESLQCHADCGSLGCFGPLPSQCRDAAAGFFLNFSNLPERYRPNCPAGAYLNKSGECLACDPSCARCTGPGAAENCCLSAREREPRLHSRH